MAFKILSPSELAILNEDERKAYETAYEEYRERAAFIERLEQLEKVQMPAVSVKKKGIKRIKAPSVPASNMRDFIADTTQGAILLNATKRVKATLESNTHTPSIAKFKADLPCVGVVSPEYVSIEKNAPYKVSTMSVVPIAAATDVRFEVKDYKISNLQHPQYITPNTEKVKLNSYTVTGLPEIDTSVPDVSIAPMDFLKNITLENIPIVKPTVIDTVIAKYELSSCEKTIVTAPEVKCEIQNIEPTEFPVIPVAKPEIINGEVNTVKVDAPVPLVITAPEISVRVSTQHVSSLKSVIIPVAASTINVTTASVKKVNPTILASPNDVKYAAPDYHVSFTDVSFVSAPIIDEKKELSAILSKIR